MFGIIRLYTYEKQHGQTIADVSRNEFQEILKQHDGFVSYHFIDSGDGEGASMAIFTSKEAAEASTFLAGGFVHDRLADLLPNPPRVIEGEV
jgi:hypothetical protein